MADPGKQHSDENPPLSYADPSMSRVQRAVVTPWPDTHVGEVGREGFAALEKYAKDIGLV